MPYINKEQQRKARQKHYQENKDKYRARLYAKRQINYSYLISLKIENGCCKCGEKHPACLDFHHRNPDDKEIEISKVADHWGLVKLKKEVEKCDVLCSNCHRKEHWVDLDKKYYFDYANRNNIEL